MREFVNDLWWMMLFRGLALLFFGIAAVIWPGITLVLLAVFFAAYLFVAGVMDIISALGSTRSKRGWFLVVLLGVLEIGVGVYLLSNPGLSVATYLFIIGATLIVQGVLSMVAAFTHTEDRGLKFLAVIGGILAILAGFYILRHPVAGGLAFVWVLGVYGIVGGAFEIAAALSLKSAVREIRAAVAPRRAARR